MSRFLNPKNTNLSISQLLKEALPSHGARARAETGSLPKGSSKPTTNEPSVKPISFGRPSRRTTSTSTSSGAGGVLTDLASSLLGGSLVGSLSSLFGGSGRSTQQLSLFKLPDSTQATLTLGGSRASGHIAALSSSGGALAHLGQSLSAGSQASRAISEQLQATKQAPARMPPGSSVTGAQSAAGHQVHIHVSALDSQSFLDRSSHIAQAVKTAILQSNSLNDVIAEL